VVAAVAVLAVAVTLVFGAKECQRVRSGGWAGGSAVVTSLTKAEPLPAGWSKAVDPTSGRAYYIDSRSGTAQWTPPSVAPPPPPPPPGVPSVDDAWEELRDPGSGTMYFYNKLSGESAWTRPAPKFPTASV